MNEKVVLQRASPGEWAVFLGAPLALGAAAVMIVKAASAHMSEVGMAHMPEMGTLLLVPLAMFIVLFVAGLFVMAKLFCCSFSEHAGGELPFGKTLGSALRAAATAFENISSTLTSVNSLATTVAGELDVQIPALQFKTKRLNTVPLPGANMLPDSLLVVEVDASVSVNPLHEASAALSTDLNVPVQATADAAQLLRQAAAAVEG